MNPTTIKVGAAAVAGVVLLTVGLPWLSPLGELFPNTRSMVVTTGEILTETEHLQDEVAKVQVNLAKVQKQDQLLAEQERLMQETVTQLRRQEGLAESASGKLATILDKERTTAQLTARAAQAAGATMATVRANEAELGRLTAATVWVQDGSATIDRQLVSLLGELEESAANFAVIARWKEAFRRALERFGR
ncbi:MAG TPA: hypothetical protein VD902_20670 [Symbiobacteriaceae bacterium]|nr:hypothetical protein [Symbiobacteriaceae bacterium]